MVDDVDFFFDPTCPWAWRTACFVREVAGRRRLQISWRFMSLRVLNEDRDYADFPNGYWARHEYGRSLLRVAARVREDRGNAGVEQLYIACGSQLHEGGRLVELATDQDVSPILRSAGFLGYLEAASDELMDDLIRRETALAIARSGPNLGTPVITFGPPSGPSFFGPVMSAVPEETEQDRIWDSLVHLAHVPELSELKRTRAQG